MAIPPDEQIPEKRRMTNKEIIEEFAELVIKDLNSKYHTTEKKKWLFDWRRGACWGIRRGEHIIRKRLKELV